MTNARARRTKRRECGFRSFLRRVARRRLQREQPGHALQATALVHEVYLRLVDVDRLTLKNRTHFFAVAAKLMRQILVDHARRQHADKRGGGATMVSVDDVSLAAQPRSVDVLALDQALEALSSIDARQGGIVELRFFGGLDIEEAAEALGISRLRQRPHSRSTVAGGSIDGCPREPQKEREVTRTVRMRSASGRAS